MCQAPQPGELRQGIQLTHTQSYNNRATSIWLLLLRPCPLCSSPDARDYGNSRCPKPDHPSVSRHTIVIAALHQPMTSGTCSSYSERELVAPIKGGNSPEHSASLLLCGRGVPASLRSHANITCVEAFPGHSTAWLPFFVGPVIIVLLVCLMQLTRVPPQQESCLPFFPGPPSRLC